ncbi:ATP-dependent Clp protease ATP-binding subunit ClpC [Candidatus Termititenax persephonae]|uniref:ATP-dependent Clp protease ATP-binding subunit ClpC n=1 Tax=Candidatus Termititenax persephonae TaxID=2218525 RepID=A0A388TG16_9BACT|nr:ATP-dependent Clp protease ATP-binding subunit ClpC [Candidatus Termititenax persephonae]
MAEINEINNFDEFEDFLPPELRAILSQIFGPRRPDRMFDYFSNTANKVLYLAAEEVRRLGHKAIDTEHILLGLIKSESSTTQILKDMDLDLVKAFSDIEILVGQSNNKIPVDQPIMLTPRAKKALELAYQTAMQLGYKYVGPEHILLGLLRENEGLAAQVLHKNNITLEKTVKAVNDRFGDRKTRKSKNIDETFFQRTAQNERTALTTFGRDLTELAYQARLDPVIGREKEIDRMIRILSRRTKNNPVLIGDPGVGKTAIVEGLAQRIVSGDVPETLQKKHVIELDLAGMIAGTKHRGEFEERIKAVMDELRQANDQTIVFIDEIHNLVGAGSAEGALDAANILKPALSRGEMQCIGATTIDEYRKYIEKDSALERRFQPIHVDQPSLEDTTEILKGLRDRYEAHHRVQISDQAITAAVNMSSRYITERFLPDKAIDVIDEAAAKVRLASISLPPEIQKLKKDSEVLQKEQASVTHAADKDKLEKINARLKDLQKNLADKTAEWKAAHGSTTVVVTEADIAGIIADWTGIPATRLEQKESEKLLQMETELHKRVVGQNNAIEAIAEAIRRSRAGVADPNKPSGVFLFAGPTGVGKTELAKTLAEFLFGSADKLIRLDMSEYIEKFNVSRLIGAAPGYVGYDEGGQLTERVRRNPYSVILLDEIEKAHPEVFNILLQVMDDGQLTDAQGRTVNFKNTVIIMTTNAGSEEQGRAAFGFIADKEKEIISYEKMKEKLQGALKNVFRPEFLNRIDEIILFKQLTKAEVRQIVDLLLERLNKQLRQQNITARFSSALKDYLIEIGYDPNYGARPLKRAIQRNIENRISKEIIAGQAAADTALYLDIDQAKNITVREESLVAK